MSHSRKFSVILIVFLCVVLSVRAQQIIAPPLLVLVSTPYSGMPFLLPGKLEAENFDIGEHGVIVDSSNAITSIRIQEGQPVH